MVPCEEYHFYLYCPEGVEGAGEIRTCLVSRLPGVVEVPWFICETLQVLFDDLGEINPDYSGLKKMAEHFVLSMFDRNGHPVGFCSFIPERIDLIQIDIILIKKEFRQRGLGRLLLGYLEQALEQGTIMYVRQTTGTGRKFFTRCGFARDVQLFKVLSDRNRLFKTRSDHSPVSLASV
ncbi:GNAT family N-acetyltransferase [Desulfofundulus sp.]|uniref:GNAT family N-acetyltransferase n=1 Tax=Desulfofundulus sp. TaxID=2282750 RepID=UPI003C779654